MLQAMQEERRMRRWWISAILMLAVGLGGFALGHVGQNTRLRQTAISNVQQAYVLFDDAIHEPAPAPKTFWTAEGIGYLQASVGPLESLGISNMNVVVSAVDAAAYDASRHQASPQEIRLLALFQRKMAAFHQYSFGSIPVARLKQAVNSLAAGLN